MDRDPFVPLLTPPAEKPATETPTTPAETTEPQRVVVEVEYPPVPPPAQPQPLPAITTETPPPATPAEHDPDRRAHEHEADAEPTQPFVLTGVLTAEPRVAILRRGDEHYVVGVGEDVADQGTLTEIAEDSVTLDRHGELERIPLRTPEAAPPGNGY